MSLLKTDNLEKSFGGVVAAKNINIEINESEIVSVIGSNGAGKTTFVNMVTGYLNPTAGNIYYKNTNITGFNPRQTVAVGIHRSFQIPQLFADMTALENVLFSLMISHDQGKPKLLSASLQTDRIRFAEEILARFSLEQHAHEKVKVLPQGIRKQLDIAMAAIGNPSMILLDEPTSGVSSDEKLEMMDIIFEPLLETGASILFIEHDMDIVKKYSKRVIAFYEGGILKDGTVEEVMSDAKVKQFIIGESHA